MSLRLHLRVTSDFPNFFLESQAEQCAWCGEVKGRDDLRLIQEDVPRHYVLVCQGCWEQVNSV